MPDVLGRALFTGMGDGTEAGTGGGRRRPGTSPGDDPPPRNRDRRRRSRPGARALAPVSPLRRRQKITQEAHDQVRRHPALPRLGQGPSDSAHHGFELDAARGMGLRIEEDLDVPNALLTCTGQVGGGELVEIPLMDEDRACPVIDIQERLQVAEAVRPPDGFRVRVREPDAGRRASSNINSGSSVPSICRCNSALGNVNGSIITRAHSAAKTMSWAPFQSVISPSGRRFSFPSNTVREWLPASWPTMLENVQPP